MAAHLTDRQKKKILADYVEMGSYNAVAKKHGCSDRTVKRVVLTDPDMRAKVEQKKAENTADVLAHMDTKRSEVCAFIDLGLQLLRDPDKLKNASLREIATTMGILIDKWTAAGNTVAAQAETGVVVLPGRTDGDA